MYILCCCYPHVDPMQELSGYILSSHGSSTRAQKLHFSSLSGGQARAPRAQSGVMNIKMSFLSHEGGCTAQCFDI